MPQLAQFSHLDTDATMAGNSDQVVASQKATKSYADSLAGALNAVTYKGVIDCSANPNYPAADAGDLYVISVAGKIGGASGVVVEAGDSAICKTDGTLAGTQAQRGTAWNIAQTNVVNAAGIVNTPAGNVAATTVQAAIDELDTDKEIAGAAATAQAAAIAAAAIDATTKADAAEAAAIAADPVKATGAEVNTGTDDAKFATALAIADSYLGDLVSAPAAFIADPTDEASNVTATAAILDLLIAKGLMAAS